MLPAPSPQRCQATHSWSGISSSYSTTSLQPKVSAPKDGTRKWHMCHPSPFRIFQIDWERIENSDLGLDEFLSFLRDFDGSVIHCFGLWDLWELDCEMSHDHWKQWAPESLHLFLREFSIILKKKDLFGMNQARIHQKWWCFDPRDHSTLRNFPVFYWTIPLGINHVMAKHVQSPT